MQALSHKHEQRQVVGDRAALGILGLIPLPTFQVIDEIFLLALRFHLENRIGLDLKELTLKPMDDAIDLRIKLL